MAGSPMDFSSQYTLIILKEGHCSKEANGVRECQASVSLLLGPHNILIGTGLPQDQQELLKGLQKHSVNPDNIEYVICHHGSMEYIGNLGLFPKATHIVGYQVMKGSTQIMHDFKREIPFEIDEDVEVLPTPGAAAQAVSVLVTNSNLGTAAICGGLFQSEDDLENPDLWETESADLDAHQQSRIDILKLADHIVPRFGKLFRVPDSYKGSEMKVVMTP